MRDDERPPKTMEEVREANARFAETIARRNVREILAAVVVVAFFAYGAARDGSPLLRTGAILIALGATAVAIVLLLLGRPKPPPATDAPLRDGIGHYREELARQRDLLASSWRWYVAPLIPGFVLRTYGLEGRRIAATLLVLVFSTPPVVLVVWLNRRAARKLDERIGALSR